MARLRVRALSLLEQHGGMTARSIADALHVDRSAASRTIVRAHSAGLVHIANWLRTGYALAPLYAAGPGVDTIRPAPKHPNECSAEYRKRHPERHRAATAAWRERARRRTDVTVEIEPIVPVESCSKNPVLPAKEIVVSESVSYFEIDVLPGVKHFTCDRYKATLSVRSCAERWAIANEGASEDRQDERRRACRLCAQGALHAGKSDLNMSPWKGSMMCARCGEGASRLVGRHLCLSHFNRQREVIRGVNGKGTAPKMHPPLSRRSVSFLTYGAVKTKTIEYTIGLEEVMFSVLRDEVKTVKFGGINVHPALAALRANPDLDFEIRDDVEAVPVASVANVADVVQDLLEHAVVPIVPIPLADVNVRVPSELDVVQADPAADVEADPYDALRDAVEQLEHDAPLSMPTMSRRAAKKLRQQARRQIRLSNVTVQLLRSVKALPPAPPIVVPVPEAQPSYSAALMSGGTAFG